MWRKVILAAPFAAAASPTLAEEIIISDCDWLADMRNIVEPWEESTRTFYEGQERVVLIDAIEPACCWAHLLLLMPDKEDELGGRACVAVNPGGGRGFSGLEFEALKSSHDPNVGLTLSFPYALFDPGTGEAGSFRQGQVLINLATGKVSAQ